MVETDVIVAIIYLIIGIFGVTENVLTAVLINGSKEMQNPTYSYIVQSCVCDTIVLTIIAILSGLLLLFPVMRTVVIRRIGTYILGLGWYGTCFFMVLTTVTRWLQLEYPHKLKAHFTTRFIRGTIGTVYLLPACLCTWFLYLNPIPFDFLPGLYTWNFDRTNAWGDGLAYTNTVFNGICSVLIASINFRSYWSIRRSRLQVLSINTKRNRQREIKLFIQCAITGTIYIITVIEFFVTTALSHPTFVEYMISNFVWLSHHVHQPIVYIAMNAGLRRAFAQRIILRLPCINVTACRQCLPKSDNLAQSTEAGVSAGRPNKYSDVAPQ